MRTRDKHLSDYGLDKDDIAALRERCRHLDDEDMKILEYCARESAPGLERQICESIKGLDKRVGYRTLDSGMGVPAKAVDFYAYRRKTLGMFWQMLRLLRRI